jgi:hypothetical protein
MGRVLSAAVALAVLAVPSWAGLANHSLSGTAKTAPKGIYALLGEAANGKGKLVLPASDDALDLVTTDSGWTLSGGSFGSLSGAFATNSPGKIYTGSVATPDVVTWIGNRLSASYAAVTNVAATGIASFRPNAAGTRVSVFVVIPFTAEMSGTYFAGGVVKIKGNLVLP